MRFVLDHWPCIAAFRTVTDREEEDIGLQWAVVIARLWTRRLLNVDPPSASLHVDASHFRMQDPTLKGAVELKGMVTVTAASMAS